MNEQNDFSGIPSLNDSEGLQNYLNDETLKTVGAAPVQDQQQTQEEPNAEQPQQGLQSNVTSEQIQNIMNNLNAINQRLNTQPSNPVQQQTPTQNTMRNYSDVEKTFIVEGLKQGYSLDQINNVIMSKRNQNGSNSATAQRIANIEKYLQEQEYANQSNAFIEKISNFGDKWGLSEQDLVTFGESALQKGINIAMPNIDLEMVFRAVYPEQYYIRSQRMSQTSTSQIYGGNSIPEGTRQNTSRLEDAYVENFLAHAMPNYGNKK